MLRKDDLTIADGEEGNGVVEEATALIDNGRWSLCNDGKGLERSFKFKTFKTTWVSSRVGIAYARAILCPSLV